MRLDRKQAFGIAGVLALVVAALIYFALSSATKKASVEPPKVTAIVAAENIPALSKITEEMLDTKIVRASAAPSNALTSPSQAIGRRAQFTIPKGQLVITTDIIAQGGGAQGLTFVIPKGKRAVTVQLDAISGVGGFVQPGDHVDVMATIESTSFTATRLILQAIEVLAMNAQTVRPQPVRGDTSDDSAASTKSPVAEQVESATLSVTSEEAQRLILAAAKGSIHLALRSREDMDEVGAIPATSNWDLMDVEPPLTVGLNADGTPIMPPATLMTGVPGAGMPPDYYMGYRGVPPINGAVSPDAPTPVADAPKGPTIEIIRGTDREIVATAQ